VNFAGESEASGASFAWHLQGLAARSLFELLLLGSCSLEGRSRVEGSGFRESDVGVGV
jgi:hypothetical protein